MCLCIHITQKWNHEGLTDISLLHLRGDICLKSVFFQKRSSLGIVKMRHGGFQVTNSGTLRDIFKITGWIITELSKLSYIMRLSFVLIMKVSIKLHLHQDKHSHTIVARGTILLKESSFSFKGVMTLLQLLWQWVWLKEKAGSWGVWGTQIKSSINFTLRGIWQ